MNETFGSKVSTWLGTNPSEGKRARLQFLCEELQLLLTAVQSIYYQLLHRTVSAIIEAKRIGTTKAVVLVHSFSTENKGYDAFNEFLHLFGASVEINSVSQLVSINRVDLYFAWVNDL